MLADTPLAFMDTVADAVARPHADYASRCALSSTSDQQALFVAESLGRLVGQVGGFVRPAQPDRTVLNAVYVSPPYRGGPTLAGLVDAIAMWSRACDRRLLELEVVTSNIRAGRAYQKLGFVPIGDLIPHPTLAVLTEQRMVRVA